MGCHTKGMVVLESSVLTPSHASCRALIAYVNILADVLSSVAGTIVPPGAEPSRNVMLAAITFMGAL